MNTLSDVRFAYSNKLRQAINAGNVQAARDYQSKLDAVLQLIDWKGASAAFTNSDATLILKAA